MLKVQIICTYSLPMDVLNTILPERLHSGDSKRLGVICYIPIDSKLFGPLSVSAMHYFHSDLI